jgi:hypothetical protein
MFENPSLTTRIAIGKGVGFLFGLAGFLLLPSFLPEADWLIRWGILLWYTTVGAIIGVFGVYTSHPIIVGLPFLRTLGSRNRFSATSCDQLPLMLASYLM